MSESLLAWIFIVSAMLRRVATFSLSMRSKTSIVPRAVASQSKDNAPIIVWFRRDLRIADHLPLAQALVTGRPVVPIYLWSYSCPPITFEPHSTSRTPIDESGVVAVPSKDAEESSSAAASFCARALASLEASLCDTYNLKLIVAGTTRENEGNEKDATPVTAVVKSLVDIVEQCGPGTDLLYYKNYDPEAEEEIERELDKRLPFVSRKSFPGYLLFEPSEDFDWPQIIARHPFASPLIPFVDEFLQKCKDFKGADDEDRFFSPLPLHLDRPDGPSVRVPLSLSPATLVAWAGSAPIKTGIDSRSSENWSWRRWDRAICAAWPATEAAAALELQTFLEQLPVKGVDKRPQSHFVSRISPYLSHGLLSPASACNAAAKAASTKRKDSTIFLRRLLWRDYSYHVWKLFPDIATQHPSKTFWANPIRQGYPFSNITEVASASKSRSAQNAALLHKWKSGGTGFPLVDAGMRQLWTEGYMPQKVRLVVSTFFCEVLGLDWRLGAAHFERCLVDFDPAINANMWMNAACAGFDPWYFGGDYKRRPYWDTSGEYVLAWVPELLGLGVWRPDKPPRGGQSSIDCLYAPWAAPAEALAAAGVRIGSGGLATAVGAPAEGGPYPAVRSYPERCVDERAARAAVVGRMRSARRAWRGGRIDTDLPLSLPPAGHGVALQGQRRRRRGGMGFDVVPLGRRSGARAVPMFTPKALRLPPRNVEN